MPSSTTLETMVLEINSSAVKANEGIGRTIGSLRSLAKAVGTVLPYLREMNRELLRTSRIKMPNIGGAITRGAGKSKGMTTEEIKAWQAQAKPTFRYFADSSSMIPDAELRKLHPEWYTTEQQRAANALANARPGGQASWATEPQKAVTGYNQVIEAQGKVASSAKAMSKSVSAAKAQIKSVGKAAEESKPKMSGFAKNMNMIGRIAKTMIIRTIIRNLIKAFGEAWNAAYEFSRKMGGSFANAVDAAHTMLTDVAVSLVKTFAPAFEAILPIIKVVSDAIQYLCRLIQELFRWFGLVSDVTNASTSSIGKYTNAAGKGSKATKNMLASWDQLNVIQSQGSNGSGGGSSYKPGSLKNIVDAETNAIIQMITGEIMLALGLILACTGHIGIGIGMMVIGGAAIAKTLTTDWNTLPKHVQDTISQIMVIAGTSMLALGVILLCTGNIPLGIGMIAAGVANIGLAVGLNWTSIVEDVKKVMTDIGDWFVARWNDITTAASNAWDTVKKWWETNVVDNMKKDGVWGGVKGFFEGIFNPVKEAASNAWTVVNDWMDANIGTSFRTAWGSVSDLFHEVFGTTEQPDTVVGIIHGAYQDASEWWNTNVTERIKLGWDVLPETFKNIFGSTEQPDTVVGWIHGAFQDVSEWWTTNVTEKVKEQGAWGGVVGFFEGIWGSAEDGTGISGMFNKMWTSISALWGDIVSKVEGAWTSVGTWFYTNVTKPVSDFFINMINRIIDGLNWVIDCLNTVGHIQFGGLDLGIFGKIDPIDARLFEIPRVEYISFGANGLYDIPAGDLFVANEAGAELVGSMNGKTTVANQEQIIQGIQRGVRDANSEQNELLRRQNELLRGILEKSGKYEIKPSAEWGRFNQRSAELWSGVTGR